MDIDRNRPERTIQITRENILFTFACALALYVAWLTRKELFVLYVSALFAVVLMPIVRFFMRLRIRGWSPNRGIAIVILFLLVGGFVALFLGFAVPPVVHDLHQLLMELPTRGPEMLQRVQKLPIASHVNVTQLNARLQAAGSEAASWFFSSLTTGAGKIADLLTALVLILYFILEGESAYYWILSFFAPEPRARLDKTLARAELRMGKWLVGQGSLMLILGVLSTIAFTALHIRYSYALGVLMGLFNLIPVMGAVVSMALVLVVAAIDSWGRVLGALIFYVVYVQVENAFLTPRIMKSSVDLSGLGVLVALLIGSALGGVVGAMVSVPTAVLVSVLLEEYLSKTPAQQLPDEVSHSEQAAL